MKQPSFVMIPFARSLNSNIALIIGSTAISYRSSVGTTIGEDKVLIEENSGIARFMWEGDKVSYITESCLLYTSPSPRD